MPSLPFIEAVLAEPSGAQARAVVFDIDNTVADTRYRTLAVAAEFDARQGSAHFRDLTLAQVGLDGASTAQASGAPPSVVSAFQQFWQSDEGFWSGAQFVHDRPLEPVASIARRAEAAGIEVIWLTGRVQALRAATERWLLAQRLCTRTLVCKQDLSVRTARFKAEFLSQHCQTRSVGFFMTESARDIAAVQAVVPSLECVLVDFPQRDVGVLARETPLLGLDNLSGDPAS